MNATIVPPYLHVLTTRCAVTANHLQQHLHLKAVALMPTAGDKLLTDSVTTSKTERRIVINLTAAPPQRIALAEPTPLPISIDLGQPAPGKNVVEIWLRQEQSAPYILQQALVLDVTEDEASAGQARDIVVGQIHMTTEPTDDELEPKEAEE